jgi:hypothetical protein
VNRPLVLVSRRHTGARRRGDSVAGVSVIPPLAALILACLLAGALASAATAQIVPFGKNKIQYESFDWHLLKGEHVDLYFYPEEAELAQVALREAERAFAQLEIKFRFHPPTRVPLIIYSSHQHFEQTNVLAGFIPEGVAGFTEFLKGRVALPFNGSYYDFRRVIQHELVHVFQIRKLLHERALHPRGRFPGLPQWFSEGLAEHWSSEWSPEGNLFVGDFVLSGNLPHVKNLSVYNGTFAIYKLGQSVHEFLEREYGDERLILFFESLWKYKSFESALWAVYGLTLDELDARWRYDLEQRYFPLVARSAPIEVAAREVISEGTPSFKPTIVPRADSLPSRFCYVSPRTGYMNVYCASLSGRDEDVETVLETERTPEFESIHGFTSSLDVNERGELALVSKFGASDALFVLELESSEILLQRRFEDLVALSSPTWGPGGVAVAFVGLSRSGFSDLYVYRRAGDRLERLTENRFLEASPAWSPDGAWIAYASDSIPGGADGAQNLFARNVSTGEVRALTAGRWRDTSPRWFPDGRRVLFTSDRSGILNLYEVDLQGNGRRLTDFTGGVLDGEPFRFLDGDGSEKDAVLFTGFEEAEFQIYRMTLPDSAAADSVVLELAAPDSAAADSLARELVAADSGATRIGLPARREQLDWNWAQAVPDSGAAVASVPYRRRFSLDLAQGGGAVGGGTNVEAAQALFSDVLGDHLLLLEFFSAAQSGDDFFDAFGGEVSYLNLKQRLNWGGSAYRVKGNFSTIGTLNSPPELYRLTRTGAGGIVSYPFSKFRRLEARLNVEQSDILGTGLSFEDGRVDREGVIGVAGVSYIKDNTLWVPTGPIDGERYNVSLGGTGNFSDAEAESFFAILDYRRYFRLGQLTAYAVRGQFLYSDGLIPTRWVLGGSGTLRGYPRYGLRGSRYALLNQELRFPLLSGLLLRTPLLGGLAFPGIQGALFLDLGNAWEEIEQERLGIPGILGSYGLGLRMSLGGPLVLRLDFARIFELNDERRLRVYRFDKNRVDFFVGFNY